MPGQSQGAEAQQTAPLGTVDGLVKRESYFIRQRSEVCVAIVASLSDQSWPGPGRATLAGVKDGRNRRRVTAGRPRVGNDDNLAMHLKLGDDSCAWVSSPLVTARVSAMVTGKPSWPSSDVEPMHRRLPGCVRPR